MQQGFTPVAVPDCDSVTIRAHWRMTTNCPDRAARAGYAGCETRRRKISSGNDADTPVSGSALPVEVMPQEHLKTGFQRSSAPHRRLRRHDSPPSVFAGAQLSVNRGVVAGNTKERAIRTSFASH